MGNKYYRPGIYYITEDSEYLNLILNGEVCKRQSKKFIRDQEHKNQIIKEWHEEMAFYGHRYKEKEVKQYD